MSAFTIERPFVGVSKRGFVPLFYISPSPSRERGIKGVRFIE
jgi:hypothetical protein